MGNRGTQSYGNNEILAFCRDFQRQPGRQRNTLAAFFYAELAKQ
jgi:hypothetical protein